MIVAFALLMVIPATFLFYQYSADTKANLANAQVYKLGTELVLGAELIYSVGTESWQTLEMTFPEEVNSMTVYSTGGLDSSELVISYGDPSSDIVLFTPVLLLAEDALGTCPSGCEVNIHDGPNKIRIESDTDGSVSFKVVE